MVHSLCLFTIILFIFVYCKLKDRTDSSFQRCASNIGIQHIIIFTYISDGMCCLSIRGFTYCHPHKLFLLLPRLYFLSRIFLENLKNSNTQTSWGLKYDTMANIFWLEGYPRYFDRFGKARHFSAEKYGAFQFLVFFEKGKFSHQTYLVHFYLIFCLLACFVYSVQAGMKAISQIAQFTPLNCCWFHHHGPKYLLCCLALP